MITLVLKEIDINTCEEHDVEIHFSERMAKRMSEWVLLNDHNTDSLIMFLTDDEILNLKAGNSESIRSYQKLLIDELSEELKIDSNGVSVRGDELQKDDTVRTNGVSGILEEISNGKGLVRHFRNGKFITNWFPVEKIKRKRRDSTFFS